MGRNSRSVTFVGAKCDLRSPPTAREVNSKSKVDGAIDLEISVFNPSKPAHKRLFISHSVSDERLSVRSSFACLPLLHTLINDDDDDDDDVVKNITVLYILYSYIL
jgi:hypothetical protein